MSYVTYEWVISYTNESCHTWMRTHLIVKLILNHMWRDSLFRHSYGRRYVTHECVMSYMNEWISHVTQEWGMSRINKINGSCHVWMSEWVVLYSNVAGTCVMSHMNEWIRHVTHEWGMSCMKEWMSYVTYEWVNESCHVATSPTYESCRPDQLWVMSHTWIRLPVTHLNYWKEHHSEWGGGVLWRTKG